MNNRPDRGTAAMSDLEDELQQERREKEWAETWKPQAPGDMLIGTLEGYDEATTDFGTYTVAHVRDEDGVLKGLWLMHSVLQDEWEEAAPEVGERVGALYHGKRAGDNYDYHMWSVRVDTAAGEGSGEERPQQSRGEDRNGRPPQEAGRDSEDGAPGFDGDELYGPPATDAGSATEEAGGKSTLDDPNGELPF